MLPEHKLKALEALLAGLSRDELLWLNGYVNGVVSEPHKGLAEINSVNNAVDNITANPLKITITYGTETGNSKKIATALATKAKKSGINVKLVSLEQYRLTDLQKESYFFTVVSTHGDGEPPIAAKKFYDHIHNNGFKLNNLKYSVLALGDTSYPMFCKTGEEIDEQFSKLEGERIAPLRRCDLEYEKEAAEWVDSVLKSITLNPVQPGKIELPTAPKAGSGRKIYTSELITNINLNDTGSNKETYHLELLLDEQPEYEPGDSIGVVPENNDNSIEQIMAETLADRNREISYKGERLSIYEVLKKKVNISFLSAGIVKKYALLAEQTIAAEKTALLDLLIQYPLNRDKFEKLLTQLNPIPPRIYTIASSPSAHSNEIHLTVEKDEFLIDGKERLGLCSAFLRSLPVTSRINFFVQKNKRFRLPASNADIIMIGPGTGIAAFRSFLSERDSIGSSGKNWLFFGEQHFTSDFLYQTEIQSWEAMGLLTKVSVAFSHDQQEKLYVYDKMWQQGAEFYSWIESGAYVYVCGQKDPMSILVEKTLLRIISTYGNRSEAESLQYVNQLKENGRYSKDVY